MLESLPDAATCGAESEFFCWQRMHSCTYGILRAVAESRHLDAYKQQSLDLDQLASGEVMLGRLSSHQRQLMGLLSHGSCESIELYGSFIRRAIRKSAHIGSLN